jgi:hypothetical protein
VPPPSHRYPYRFARSFSEKIKSGNIQEAEQGAKEPSKDNSGDSVREQGRPGDGSPSARTEKFSFNEAEKHTAHYSGKGGTNSGKVSTSDAPPKKLSGRAIHPTEGAEGVIFSGAAVDRTIDNLPKEKRDTSKHP